MPFHSHSQPFFSFPAGSPRKTVVPSLCTSHHAFLHQRFYLVSLLLPHLPYVLQARHRSQQAGGTSVQRRQGKGRCVRGRDRIKILDRSGSGPAPGQRLELQGAPRGYSVQEGSCPVSRLRGAVSGKVYREAALRAPSTRMALHHQWSVVPGDEAGTAAVLKGSRQVGVRADSHPGPSAFSFQSFLSPGSAQQEAPAGSPVARGLGWGWGALSPGQPCSGV